MALVSLPSLSVNSSSRLKLLYFTAKKNKKNLVLNLLPFHGVSCSCIIRLSEMEGAVALNNFAKDLVTLLPCTLCCPTFCSLIYICPAPLCSCVQVRWAQGRELACCTARLGCQASTGWIKWTKGFLHLLWAAKHCLVLDTLIFGAGRQSRFIIRWVFEK